MHRASLIPIIVAVLAVVAGQAAAAEITQISWDITGGSFDIGPNSTGPITGGSLTWTPSTPQETPISCVGLGTHTFACEPAMAFLSLTGPSGSFSRTIVLTFASYSRHLNAVDVDRFLLLWRANPSMDRFTDLTIHGSVGAADPAGHLRGWA